MLARDVRSRVQAASLRENREWDGVKTRDDWEGFREPRMRGLRESLGLPSDNRGAPRVLVTRTLEGDGYRIENLVVESRPGLVVTANLYQPTSPPRSMPVILISHSHHNPKTQGELQDMGMTWAREGSLVLVMDQLGHGERRQHPFRTEEWCYYLGKKLVGVGYVDDLPQGLSAIYFFYDPEERQRSLGTWNVLSLLDASAARGLPHLYLGYFVAGCRSMTYKSRFVPNQLLAKNGRWLDFR